MKISLGTAQFGGDYGSFNLRGQVPYAEVKKILSTAEGAGLVMLETARGYGESESTLALLGAPSRFQIVSKCPVLSEEPDPVAALQLAFETSRSALSVSKLYGYLLHNADDLLLPGVWSALKELRDSGRVTNIGISSYDVQMARNYCDQYYLNIVQLPANVLDPWFESVDFPEFVDLHVRSVFLQGFLLSKQVELPEHMLQFSNVLQQFHNDAAAQGLTPLQAALLPLLACNKVAKIIVGVDELTQITEILQAEIFLRNRPSQRFGPYKGVTSNLTDPRKWNIS